MDAGPSSSGGQTQAKRRGRPRKTPAAEKPAGKVAARNRRKRDKESSAAESSVPGSHVDEESSADDSSAPGTGGVVTRSRSGKRSYASPQDSAPEDSHADVESEDGSDPETPEAKKKRRVGRPPKRCLELPKDSRSRRRHVSTELIALAAEKLSMIPKEGTIDNSHIYECLPSLI